MIIPSQIHNSFFLCNRCTLACLMRCWLLKNFLRNTGTGVRQSSSFFYFHCVNQYSSYLFLLHGLSRTYFVTTVRRKGDVDSIGCTTNAAPAVRTIPELSRLTQQIARHQTSGRGHSFVLVFVLFLFCKYCLARWKKVKSCRKPPYFLSVVISVL